MGGQTDGQGKGDRWGATPPTTRGVGPGTQSPQVGWLDNYWEDGGGTPPHTNKEVGPGTTGGGKGTQETGRGLEKPTAAAAEG